MSKDGQSNWVANEEGQVPEPGEREVGGRCGSWPHACGYAIDWASGFQP